MHSDFSSYKFHLHEANEEKKVIKLQKHLAHAPMRFAAEIVIVIIIYSWIFA